MENIYHAGELLAQEKANEKAIGERNGKVVTHKIIPGAVNFIEKLPFSIASSQNRLGEITVSPLAGLNGFIKVRNESEIVIEPKLLSSNPNDKFWINIKEHDKIGLLFIEPSTRRRFRLNGSVSSIEEHILVSVHQAYPNCPKYIQKRNISVAEKPAYNSDSIEGDLLTTDITGIINRADTLFVGSCDLSGNMDASHRGGPPGFIHIHDSSTLIIPDYAGNSMFNTLGNFILNPNAGILIIDFEHKKALQLRGTAEVLWNNTNVKINTGGTHRFWTFSIKNWLLMDNLKGFETNFIEYSPFNPS